jgi:IS30 family transposase
MLGESKRAAILELRKQGHGIRRIAQGLGASRKTVRRIIKSGPQKCRQFCVPTRPSHTARIRRNRLGDGQSKVTRSITAAQQWLMEIIHGCRSLEILNREADDSSDLATLLYSLKNGRRIELKKAATILAVLCIGKAVPRSMSMPARICSTATDASAEGISYALSSFPGSSPSARASPT